MTTAHIRTAYVGLGSNLPSQAGTPAETIRAAMSALSEAGEVIARSSLYETAPIGWIDQPSFVNAVIALRTAEVPEALLEKLLIIERRFGRDRGNSVSKGPRTLDLDLLMVNDAIVNTPMLSLPHPALAERRFVLAPLAEIAPEVRHPVFAKTIRELLLALPNTGENKSDCVRMMQRYP
jgi:2-amino-4-hydroxy-6-hydroxymethyldihydropteridine diphosphokinase